MTEFKDLADLPEDERITIIGRHAEGGKLVAFIVEDDQKADRYIRKLREKFKISVVDRFNGPVKGTVSVRVGPVGN